MEKSWNLKKARKNHGILWNNLKEPPVARKLAVGHLCVRQLVFWLLLVSSFNYFKVHAWSTSMLLLLNSAFMLSVVKMLLKGEVGDHALNSHGNYIVDHGKIMELCFWISVGTLLSWVCATSGFVGFLDWCICCYWYGSFSFTSYLSFLSGRTAQ